MLDLSVFCILLLGALEVAKPSSPSSRPRPGPGSLEALLCQRIWQPIFHQFTSVNFSQHDNMEIFPVYWRLCLDKVLSHFSGIGEESRMKSKWNSWHLKISGGTRIHLEVNVGTARKFCKSLRSFLQDQEMPRQSKGLRTLSVPFWIFCEAISISSPGFRICSDTRCNNIRFTTKTDIVTKWGRHGCNKS